MPRARWSSSTSVRTAGSTGSMSCCSAFRAAVDRSATPMALLLVGDGPEKPDLVELAGTLGLGDVVVFTDPIVKLRVPEVLAARRRRRGPHDQDAGLSLRGELQQALRLHGRTRIPIAFATATAFDPIEASGAGLTVEADDPDALADAFVELANATLEERRAMGEAGRRFLEREHDMARIGREFAELAGVVGPRTAYDRCAPILDRSPSGPCPTPVDPRRRRR